MMRALPDPGWPLVVLATIQAVDALLCIKPARFVAQCAEDVGWPRRLWWVQPPIKFAAAAGLLLGLWVRWLGLVTCGALVAYFVVAIAMHVRARDFGRNLFVNASGMLTLCVATIVVAFVA